MDDASSWHAYSDDIGASVSIRPVSGRTDGGLEIAFELPEDGWVGVEKELSPATLSQVREISGIRFSYMGSGAASTVELKLLYRPDSRGESAVFSVIWFGATPTDGWLTLETAVGTFECWADTGCLPGEVLDLGKLWKIDFAISNKEGDTPGSGTVVLDEVLGTR
jgi:hypothetical protein